jgi:ketosteroid isomerase-like protein
MNRRAFVAEGSALFGGAMVMRTAAPDDAAAVKRLVAEYYDVFYRGRDEKKYRALLTPDYRLLENGQIMDAAGDIATMPAPGSGYRRTDSFDFRSVTVQGDVAYAVYFLTSSISEHGDKAREVKWLESLIARRGASVWRVALLHSTRV